MELSGKTAIVTGSGTGIGRALAVEFARQGANVVCCGRRPAKLEQTVSLIRDAGGRGLAVPTDVTQRAQVDHLMDETIRSFGAVHVLFNNAGSFQAIGGLWEIEPDLWWHDVTVNLLGPMLCAQAVLPHMMQRDEGIIINMDGGGSTIPLPGGSGYGCSKAALLRMTDTLAKELARVGSGVLVFGLGPGFVRTEMSELQAVSPAGRKWIPSSKEALDQGRGRPPEDCARSAVELIRVACPALSGRVFATGNDFQRLAARADEIQQGDLLVMRFVRA